jgi:hypothetical protein
MVFVDGIVVSGHSSIIYTATIFDQEINGSKKKPFLRISAFDKITDKK